MIIITTNLTLLSYDRETLTVAVVPKGRLETKEKCTIVAVDCQVLHCIRLARGKFEFTNQDLAGRKTFKPWPNGLASSRK